MEEVMPRLQPREDGHNLNITPDKRDPVESAGRRVDIKSRGFLLGLHFAAGQLPVMSIPMKSLLIFLALGAIAHATPIVYSVAGSTAGKTFTAQLTVETTVPDGNPGDATLGQYAQTTPSLVQFSDGLTLTNEPFEYLVASSYYNSMFDVTYDALAFYFYRPDYTFGIELRFTPGTFANDFAITPTFASLTPDIVANLAATDWFYFQGSAFTTGTVDSIGLAPASVADGGPTAGLWLLSLAALAAFARQQARKIA